MSAPEVTAPGVSAGDVTVGTRLPPLTVRLSRTDLVRYAGASGDFNPIHHSEHFAAQVGLPGVVAHGLLTMGTALRVVTGWAGDPGRVRSYSCRFTKPVVVPDDGVGAEVQITGTVSAVQGDLVTVSLEVVCAGEKVLGAARVEVDLGG
ncbi:MaoC/PaaZ C-terminal domain-containing protein [uncultured Friedmanniella sp.]|uniref:MaoC/PaaZ C-terminal domain-containing protein n=1 Tax=uncultured Friedmanniella sp. TaxID=335381 RepID=UPI0035CB54EE